MHSPKMSATRKGSRNELAATVWLLDQGYEVFRNVCASGPIDIIARRGSEMRLIDVHTNRITGLTAQQQAAGIEMLCPVADGFEFVAVWRKPPTREQRAAAAYNGHQRRMRREVDRALPCTISRK